MTRPNIILINCDDLGYGDLGCFGSAVNRTPHLDRMAAEGLRCTSFCQASPVCSASRAALLTGCYPPRLSLPNVLFPGQAEGLHPAERTIANLLQDGGYATKIVGKWHCGDQPEFLPTQFGFDEYFGIPYSNDMGRQVGGKPGWGGDNGPPPLPLLRNAEVIQQQPDQTGLTERYVDESVRFLRDHQQQPFFLYLAHMYVHLPLFVPNRFLNESRNGRYGGAVGCIDWAYGVLAAELKRLGLDDNTLVIFTSDNGSRARGEGGSNAPLRGTKGTPWEGGYRLPLILRWPGRIAAGRTTNELISSLDMLPTLAAITGLERAGDRCIDGIDQSKLLLGESSVGARETLAYYRGGNLCAVRKGQWKLHVGRDNEDPRELYDLANDVGERQNLVAEQAETVAELQALADEFRTELGDRRLGLEGRGQRPCGRVANAVPLTTYDPEHPYFIAEYDLTERG